MPVLSFWRRFSGRRRRHKTSFYDSQHLMREAAREDVSGSLRHLSDEALREIVDTESGKQRWRILVDDPLDVLNPRKELRK